MNNSEKLIISHIEDLFFQCKRNAQPRFSAFLNSAEQVLIEDNVVFSCEFNTAFFGGYAQAERRIFGIFPEWEKTEEDEFPISALKIKSKFSLGHRDILGAFMSQGVDRSKIGDILINSDAAYVFTASDIARYFADNIVKIGNQGVKIDICAVSEVKVPERQTEEMHIISASLRLDAVAAAICKLSRAAAAKMITSGLVTVNHREMSNVSYTVKEKDLLSVRGHGRYVYESENGETAKGRLHITVKKYI